MVHDFPLSALFFENVGCHDPALAVSSVHDLNAGHVPLTVKW